MNRRQKLGLAAVAVLAALSFALPLLLRQNPLPKNPPPPGGGGGTNPGGGTTAPPTPPNQNGTEPPVQEPRPGHGWSGWMGLCHGEGHHFGIVRKLSLSNRTLTCA